jgi:hypothetical protein
MSKIYAEIIAPFRYEHLEVMAIRPFEREMVAVYEDKYRALASTGDGGTIVYEGVILAAFGWVQLWPGTYEVWVIPSIFVARFARVFLRTVRSYVDRLFETHPISRLQSSAIADPLHDHWMRHLGFQNETPGGMKDYGGEGLDFNLWARCRK